MTEAGEWLSDYKGRKVIVYFYPAALTPGCTKQACSFRDGLAELNDAGIDVVGISPDKPEKLAKFRDAEGLTFPLLSDPERKVLTAWGAFGEKKMYSKTVRGVIRSTFLVDEGKIAVANYNVKAAATATLIQKMIAANSEGFNAESGTLAQRLARTRQKLTATRTARPTRRARRAGINANGSCSRPSPSTSEPITGRPPGMRRPTDKSRRPAASGRAGDHQN